MEETIVMAEQEVDRKSRETALPAAIALTSFSALLLELALTRLFSVILFYHAAFLAISVALLGLGAGGVFAYVRRAWLGRWTTRGLGATLCALNAAVILLALEIILRTPMNLQFGGGNFHGLTELYLASTAPFFLTGVLFSLVFARRTRRITQLYGADLAGGALACLATVPLLSFLGGPNTILFSAVTMAAASLVWATKRRQRVVAIALCGLLLALIGANHSGRLIDIIYAKGQFRDPKWVLFARWNAISRIEVDQQGDGKAIVIDADASTSIMNVDPHKWQGTVWESDLMAAPPALANVLRPRGEYAIIGPGGGVDVLRAVANGSPSVTGIEINPIIANTIMRGKYADYAYHLYEQPEVRIEVSDGRSFIRNASQRYDVLQMTLVDTWAATAAGAFALSENGLYTVEAFREYFDHLKDDGLIAITRWEFKQPREALRVVSVAMEALRQLGVTHPQRHFIIVSSGPLDEDGVPVVVLAKKTPFTAAEEEAVRAHLEANEDLVAQYMPSEPGDNVYARMIESGDPYAFSRNYDYDVAPVNDNAPFFFFTLKTGRLMLPSGWERGIDTKVNSGVLVLGMVLVISIVAVIAFLLLPLGLHAGGKRAAPLRLLYFVAIGLGYILVEIAFIQRFVLFLGHPTYALTVVVFLLLLSSGAGSLASRRWLAQLKRGWLPLAGIVAAIALYVFVLPGVLNALVGLRFGLKLLVSGGLLAPLGFAMGMPFPTGLRALASAPAPEFPAEGANDNAVEWAWAMNAASSVLGSVLAMVIAIHSGLNVTLACGAVAYLAALGLTGKLERQQEA